MQGEVDLVVHAGDVFNRSSVVPTIAYQAYEPLVRVANRGVPVFIVPGNHERSRLPHVRFAIHPLIHIFDRPETFLVNVRGVTVGLSGFPYERESIRTRFTDVLEETGWRAVNAAVRLLCIHHCVEGATVGPADFTFTTAADVIRPSDVPQDFAAVLSGHIHRHQVLMTDLQSRPLRTPVLYPGSIERTSFAEMDEPKGFMVVRLGVSRDPTMRWEFRCLPARPMIREAFTVDGMSAAALQSAIVAIIRSAPVDAVLAIRLGGDLTEAQMQVLSAAKLRALVPETMNVEIRPAGGFTRLPEAAARTSVPELAVQLSF